MHESTSYHATDLVNMPQFGVIVPIYCHNEDAMNPDYVTDHRTPSNGEVSTGTPFPALINSSS